MGLAKWGLSSKLCPSPLSLPFAPHTLPLHTAPNIFQKGKLDNWLLCNLSFQSHGGAVWGQCQVCFVPNTCSPIFFLFNRECNPTLFPSLTFFIISSSVRVSGHYIQRTRYNWKMVKITTCSTMPLGHCAKTVKIATMATSAPLSWYQIEMKALRPRRPFIVKACQKGSLSSWPSSGVIRVVFITF